MAADRIARLRELTKNNARRQDMALAILHKVPVAMADIGHIMRSASSSLEEDLMIACGDFLDPHTVLPSFCTFYAKYFIADTLANHVTKCGIRMSADNKIAFILSALTGVTINRTETTVQAVGDARTRVISKLRVNPPPAQLLSQCLDIIIRRYNIKI